eukprot:3630621-Amphidinium_carterae.1
MGFVDANGFRYYVNTIGLKRLACSPPSPLSRWVSGVTLTYRSAQDYEYTQVHSPELVQTIP